MRTFRLWQLELRTRLSRWQASQQKSYFRWLAGVGRGNLVQLWDLQTPGQKMMPLTGACAIPGSGAP